MAQSRDPAWIWTRYWRGGRHECCAGGVPFDLSGFWHTHFSTFAAGAKLLDLATGAGQVAEFAAAAGDELGRGFAVEGVDVADLAPAAPRADGPGRSSVRLIGNTRLESLPFADASFDGVVSQFGIEYAQREPALAEAARVLRPGGRGLFVMHHAQGAIAGASATRLAVHAAVLGDGAAFRTAARVFELHLRRGPLPALLQAEAQFREIVQAMRNRLGPRPADENVAEVISFMSDLARAPQIYEPADALRRLKFAAEEVEGWRLRQVAQQAAALAPADVEAMRRLLGEAGLDVAPAQTLRAPGGEVLAWTLGFEKRA